MQAEKGDGVRLHALMLVVDVKESDRPNLSGVRGLFSSMGSAPKVVGRRYMAGASQG